MGFDFLFLKTRCAMRKDSLSVRISTVIPLTTVSVIYRELCLCHRKLMFSTRKLKTVTKAQNMQKEKKKKTLETKLKEKNLGRVLPYVFIQHMLMEYLLCVIFRKYFLKVVMGLR